MTDKYQDIIDYENIKLAQRITEIEKQTEKQIRAVGVFGFLFIVGLLVIINIFG